MNKLIFFLSLIVSGVIFSPCQSIAEDLWSHYYKASHKYPIDIAVGTERVWCCYSGGLMTWKKDGSSYKNFAFEYGYPTSRCYDVKIDGNGITWVSSSTGVFYFENNTWNEFKTEAPPETHSYYSLYVESSGAKWFGSFDNIKSFDGEVWNSYDAPGTVREIRADSQGRIWYVSSGGASRFENGEWTHFTEENGLAGNSLDGIDIDENDTVWFATRGGVTSFDGENWETISHRDTRAIYAGKSGKKWMAVSYGDSTGVFSFDGVNWIYYEQMAGQKAIDIYEEDDGTVWCATRDNLYKKTGDDWVPFYPDDGMPDIFIRGIAAGQDDDVWVASTNVGTHYLPIFPSGIYHFKDSTWRQYTVEDGLIDNDIFSISSDPLGNIWCGFRDGISRYDGNSWKSWDFTCIAVYYVGGIAFNDYGNGVFGHGYGLLRYDRENDRMENIENMSGVEQENYSVIAIDNDNTIWLGSQDGIYQFTGDEWIFHADPYPHVRGVSTVAVDHDGSLWIGTYQSGVRHFNGEDWELITTDNGLINNEIKDIIIDKQGVKWFVTTAGISAYNGQSWSHLDYADSPNSRYQTVSIADNNTIWLSNSQAVYRFDGFVQSVGVARQPVPETATIYTYPNPFNLSTVIEFTLPSSQIATLSVYSVTGQKIRTLLSEMSPQGKHTIYWNGLDDSGRPVSSGVYIDGLKLGNRMISRRMILVK